MQTCNHNHNRSDQKKSKIIIQLKPMHQRHQPQVNISKFCFSSSKFNSKKFQFIKARARFVHTDKCNVCHPYATCEIQHETSGECCRCLEGYVGNGKYCFQECKLAF